MTLLVLGINHKTASVDIRGQLAFVKDALADALDSLLGQPDVDEAVILSTCNRTEIYAVAQSCDAVKQWLADFKDFSLASLEQYTYCYTDIDAVEHLMTVACGLDSMVLGEPEILGQIKTSFAQACLQGAVKQAMSRLFRKVFSIAKSVRTTTRIGVCPVSVASTVCAYVKDWAALPHNDLPLSKARVLIVGAGDTSQLVARHMGQLQPAQITLVSRTLGHAREAAKKLGVAVEQWHNLSALLTQNDIVVSATASPEPVITSAMVQTVKRGSELLLVDIAVPRDIEANVGAVDGVHLRTIDDLKQTIKEHEVAREHAAIKAKQIVVISAKEFMLSLRAVDADSVIKKFREHVETLFHAELAKAVNACGGDEQSKKTLEQFTSSLMNKVMHVPCMQMRLASYEGRDELLHLTQELFNMAGE